MISHYLIAVLFVFTAVISIPSSMSPQFRAFCIAMACVAVALGTAFKLI